MKPSHISVRPYREQFSSGKARRIARLIDHFDVLRKLGSEYGYQLVELQGCLRAGLLLAALQVASSLLELFVRNLVVTRRLLYSSELKVDRKRAKAMREVEYERGVTFRNHVQLLTEVVLTSRDAQALNRFYTSTRIPLQHGLVVRFAHRASGAKFLDKVLGATIPNVHDLERVMEDVALDELDFVRKMMVRYKKFLR